MVRISPLICVLSFCLLPASAGWASSSVRFLAAGDLFLKLTSQHLEEQLAGQHYLMGVLDGLTLAKDPRLCMRSEIPLNEIVALVRAQLVSRPDIHRFNAASVVRETLATEFPCT